MQMFDLMKQKVVFYAVRITMCSTAQCNGQVVCFVREIGVCGRVPLNPSQKSIKIVCLVGFLHRSRKRWSEHGLETNENEQKPAKMSHRIETYANV